MQNYMLSFILMLASSLVVAAEKTIILSVPGMTCSACPITVKKSLSKINGVVKASADQKKLQATVTFDDSKTNVQALLDASKNAGYPASVTE